MYRAECLRKKNENLSYMQLFSVYDILKLEYRNYEDEDCRYNDGITEIENLSYQQLCQYKKGSIDLTR